MKTIEITSGEQKVLFTTKSVTFDGKEFLYAHMTNVIHSTEKHIYTFTYDGEVKLLPYDEKDEKTLNAIFSQVQKMAAQKKAAGQGNTAGTAKNADSDKPEKAEKAAEAKGDEIGSGNPKEDKINHEGVEATAKVQENSEEKSTNTDAESAEVSAKNDASKESNINVSDAFGKFKSKKSKDKKAAKAGAESSIATNAAEGSEKSAESAAEKIAEDPEKAARRKKSLKVFGIILGILLVCSVAYYFIFGTPSDPAPTNPNTTESQQYEDIDDLINDLQ